MSVPDRKQLGEHLKTLRKEAGFKSSKAFAEHLGITSSRYVEYEQGRVALPYETAWLIADALGITLDEVGGREFARASSVTPDESRVLARYRSLSLSSQIAASAMLDGLADRAKASAGGSERLDERMSA